MAAGRPPPGEEIVHPPVRAEKTLYAGFTYTGWLYAAYSWNLTGELVAEPYLNPLAMVPEEQRKHSIKRSLNSGRKACQQSVSRGSAAYVEMRRAGARACNWDGGIGK